MGEATKIEWCDSTFNPWEGCTKVGPGCDNCYAESRNSRFGGGMAANWGPGAPRRRTSVANWRKPLAWNAEADRFRQCGHCGWRGLITITSDPEPFACPSCTASDWRPARPRVFCASLADWLDNEVPVGWLVDLLDLIRQTPNLDWLLLSKRVGNWQSCLGYALESLAASSTGDAVQALRNLALHNWIDDWLNGSPPANIWLGATVVNQAEADRDIEKLLTVPAPLRFLSMEPLLGPVDLSYWVEGWMCRTCGIARVPMGEHGYCDCPIPDDYPHTKQGDHRPGMIDWVIVGGESGPNARPMHPDWVRSLRDQCQTAGVPFLFKQWGEWTPGENVPKIAGIRRNASWFGDAWLFGETDMADPEDGWMDEPDLYRIGKKAAGRLLDGRTWDQFPEVQP